MISLLNILLLFENIIWNGYGRCGQ